MKRFFDLFRQGLGDKNLVQRAFAEVDDLLARDDRDRRAFEGLPTLPGGWFAGGSMNGITLIGKPGIPDRPGIWQRGANRRR